MPSGFSPSTGGQTGTSNQPGSSFTRTNPISLEAIADLQVELAPYDVRIGNFTGANINAVTKSGTNELSGAAYFYGRNAAITGSDPAGGGGGKTPSAFGEIQKLGLAAGFPIIRNKVFWYSNEEITRRTDVIQQGAGSPASAAILSLADAANISQYLKGNYGIDPGTYGNFNTYSNSNKIFNRLDWNISGAHQLAIRNNTVTSDATTMERDDQDFRFSGIGYRQTNNQTSTVLELKSRFTNQFSNSFTAGYSTIHDWRDPLSDPAIPPGADRRPGPGVHDLPRHRPRRLHLQHETEHHRGHRQRHDQPGKAQPYRGHPQRALRYHLWLRQQLERARGLSLHSRFPGQQSQPGARQL